MATTYKPRAGQARQLSFNVSGNALSAGKLVADITDRRVMIIRNENDAEANAVYDKNDTDDSSQFGTLDANGVYTLDLLAADFGSDLLIADVDYYVFSMVKCSGVTGWIKNDNELRIEFI